MKWNISRKWVIYSFETNGCNNHTQQSFTYSSSKIETPEHCVNQFKSLKLTKTTPEKHQINDIVLVSLLLTSNN